MTIFVTFLLFRGPILPFHKWDEYPARGGQ